MKVWLNGVILPSEAARIAPNDRGFTLGDGVFETIRAVNGQPVHMARHLRRLRVGLAVLALPIAWTDAALANAIALCLRVNGLEQAAVRLTVSRGPASRGILPPLTPEPTVLVAAGPLASAAGPAHAITCTITRRNEFSPLSGVKSLSYLDGILARREAAKQGADEALLLNIRGRVAEASAANLFVFRAGTLATPPLADGALPGIMREVLIERCGASEAPLGIEDVLAAEAAFLSSSLGLRPLASLDGQPLGACPDRIADLARLAMPD